MGLRYTTQQMKREDNCKILTCPAYLFCQYNLDHPCFRCDACDNFWFEGMGCLKLPMGCRREFMDVVTCDECWGKMSIDASLGEPGDREE